MPTLLDLTKAIGLDPANPTAYFQRALVRLEQKRWNEAIADNTRAIKPATRPACSRSD
jgi:hypothetical protein